MSPVATDGPIQARFWFEWGVRQLDKVFSPLVRAFVPSILTQTRVLGGSHEPRLTSDV